MTIAEAIRRCDELLPNRFKLEQKLKWLASVEGEIFRDIIATHHNPGICPPVINEDTDGDTRLIVPEPYDVLYIHYLQAMIHYENMEIAKYNNAKTLYNDTRLSFRDFWNRHNLPNHGTHNFHFGGKPPHRPPFYAPPHHPGVSPEDLRAAIMAANKAEMDARVAIYRLNRMLNTDMYEEISHEKITAMLGYEPVSVAEFYEVTDGTKQNLEIAKQDIESKIKSESNKRESSDKLITERVNALSTLPEGSTSGDAEIIDARIDSKGNVYSNIGEAIRSQVNVLNDNLGKITEFEYSTVDGYISSDGSIAEPSAYNEVTTMFIPVAIGMKIGFEIKYPNAVAVRWCAYHLYDEDMRPVGNRTVFAEGAVDHIDTVVTVPDISKYAKYIRFSWRTQAGIDVRISCNNVYDESVEVNKRLNTLESDNADIKAVALSEELKTVIDGNECTMINTEWENGGIDANGNEVNATRLRSAFIPLEGAESITINIENGYRIAYHIYSGNNADGWTYGKWWHTGKVNLRDGIDYCGGYIRICLADATDKFVPERNMISIIREPKKIKLNNALYGQLIPARSTRWIYAKGAMWKHLWNTVESYEAAGQDDKCWGISGDVQFTSDGNLVMYHDPKITFNGSEVSVNSLTLAQIRSIELVNGDKKYKVPTFEEYIGICRKNGKFCIIETKSAVSSYPWTSNGHTNEFERIISKVYELGMQDCTAFAVPTKDIRYLRTNYPQMCRIPLWDGSITANTILNTYGDISDPQTIPAGYAEQWAESGLVPVVHKWGRKLFVYGKRPQTQADLESMVNIGADAVFTFIDPSGVV